MAASAAVLPIGLWCNGSRAKEAVLRPMTGEDQEFLMESGVEMPPARRTSAILARCVQRVGRESTITPELMGQLTVGDREALMLRLRMLTFGDKFDPIVRCPQTQCHKPMDVSLRVSGLLIGPSTDSLPEYIERELSHGQTIRFRLPCGQDQEAVAGLAVNDATAAARSLLARCLYSGGAELPPGAFREIGAWMAELDPQAEIRLDLTCPECGHAFTSLLDTSTYLFEENTMRSRELYREVHQLAFHYHWSEESILGMHPPRRKRYLELLREALE